jgi:two-component system sensor histidine kinase TctE
MAAGEHQFFDGVLRGERLRLAAYRAANGYSVQVGETLHKRDRLVREILLAELVPTLLIAVTTVALAWWGVARGLRPLAHMRNELLGRSPRDLRPIPETASPIEISPVVAAFNNLLQQLQESSTMQQRFLANAAHQLRTPLAGLQMHLELMLRRDLSDDVRTELQRMHGATIRAGRLATQLLALAKAESVPDHGKPLEIVDLVAVAGDAARDWSVMAIERRIDLGFALSPARTRGDPLLLPELVDNLIDNALRYTPAGGTVTVGTGVREGMSYLCVEDTGPGIGAEEREKVFERFYRVAGTEGDGSGLGLAIVKEIVDRHEGAVAIGPCEEHGGTRICVSFPGA